MTLQNIEKSNKHMYFKLRDIVFSLIDFLFPSYCINCGILVKHKDICLCNICYENIEYFFYKCKICSSTLVGESCNICSDRILYIENNITIAEYSGVMKEILHNYKFNNKRRLYKILSKIALRKILHLKDSIDMITSVPINRKNRWNRGFNQSELIAKDIAKKLRKKYKSVLKEKYHFKIQKKLGYRDRFLNVLDRYKVKNVKSFYRKSLLIIDDIFTTGATVNECARILRSFGADKVYSLTMASARIKRLDKFPF